MKNEELITEPISGNVDDQLCEKLLSMSKILERNQRPPDPKVSKILEDNLWDLV